MSGLSKLVHAFTCLEEWILQEIQEVTPPGTRVYLRRVYQGVIDVLVSPGAEEEEGDTPPFRIVASSTAAWLYFPEYTVDSGIANIITRTEAGWETEFVVSSRLPSQAEGVAALEVEEVARTLVTLLGG